MLNPPRGDGRPALAPAILDLLDGFAPIALEELAAFALLNRVDTKYLLSVEQAEQILATICPRYRILEIDGLRHFHYHTLYFDTPDLRMYQAHHNGARDRYKVRVRSYVDTGIHYFEIKRKTNRNRTIKTRTRTAGQEPVLSHQMAAMLSANSPYPASAVAPSVVNQFLRVSMAGVDDIERLTLDFSVSATLEDRALALPRLVIAEVKQPKFTAHSPFVQQLRALHLESASFSKYCYTIAALKPSVRSNLFKERMLHLDRILARGG